MIVKRKSVSKKRRKPSHSDQSINPDSPELYPDGKITEWPDSCSFKLLLPELQHSLSGQNFKESTPVQRQCIPILLGENDLLATAQTGTGKTAAFILPLLQKTYQARNAVAGNSAKNLILAPTRELALQIQQELKSLGSHLRFRETVVYGGVSQNPQVKAMRRGVDFLIATPGRLLDLMNQGHIKLDAVESLVLDEADRMLDMGFIHDVRRIIAKLPKKRNVALFSATFPKEVRNLSDELLEDPEQIVIAPEKITVDQISQSVFFVTDKGKHPLLLHLLEDPKVRRVIIFVQMKHTANKLVEKLDRANVESMAIHGNKSQAARIKALDRFRRGQLSVLIATDVAARGIDVEGITHVINYQLPEEAETYVHRIGRTGRAGESGSALSFCSSKDLGNLKSIERMLKRPIHKNEEHPFHCPLTAQMADKPKNGTKKKNKAKPRRKNAYAQAKPRRKGSSLRRSKSNSK